MSRVDLLFTHNKMSEDLNHLWLFFLNAARWACSWICFLMTFITAVVMEKTKKTKTDLSLWWTRKRRFRSFICGMKFHGFPSKLLPSISLSDCTSLNGSLWSDALFPLFLLERRLPVTLRTGLTHRMWTLWIVFIFYLSVSWNQKREEPLSFFFPLLLLDQSFQVFLVILLLCYSEHFFFFFCGSQM